LKTESTLTILGAVKLAKQFEVQEMSASTKANKRTQGEWSGKALYKVRRGSSIKNCCN